MKRFFAIFLALILCASLLCLAGCGDSTTPSNTTASSTSQNPDSTTASTEAFTTTASSNEQPPVNDGKSKLEGHEDTNFRGKTFVIAAQDNSSGDGWYTTKEVYPDAKMTDAISVAVRERNHLVESLYNCKIDMHTSASPTQAVSADITGQKYTIDLYTYEYGGAGMYTSGNNYNLLNYIEVTNPWWDQNYVSSLTIKNKNGADILCGIVGDFSITSFACTHVLFYNKTVYENADIGYDINDLVESGAWTMDAFADIVYLGKHDADGNQQYHYEEGDTLGWVRVGHATHGLHVASGMKIIGNDNGNLYFDVERNTSTWFDIIDRAIDIWSTEGAETISYTSVQHAIEEGKAIFASEVLEVIERMKNVENLSVGLLPYPKYSEDQKNYAHYVDSHLASYCMPISVTDPDMTGEFFELYAYHSRYTVREAFVQTYSTVYCDDEASAKNLNLILDTRTYDPGYLFWTEFESQLGNMIGGTNNLTQYAGKYSSTVVEKVNELVKAMTEKTEA